MVWVWFVFGSGSGLCLGIGFELGFMVRVTVPSLTPRHRLFVACPQVEVREETFLLLVTHLSSLFPEVAVRGLK
jgi:hypothetical protein